VLHNFLHLSRITGFIKENENTFDVQRTWDYLRVFNSFEWADFGQFFSFLGWIGVSAFIFVSGVGLVKKYENKLFLIDAKEYVFHSWKKLAFLLLPGISYFLVFSIIDGTWLTVIPKSALQLTLMNNFFIPIITFSPGVYWYFGLAFELYLLFLLLRRSSAKSLFYFGWGIVGIQVIVVLVFGLESGLWSWVRHNFLGWGQVFIMGMIVGKTGIEKYLPNKLLPLLLFAILSLCLLPLLMLNVWTWLLIVPFVAALFFVFLAGAASEVRLWKTVGLWLGRYSAYFFVVHPLQEV